MNRAGQEWRREQKSWQEVLETGRKLRVMLKSELTPPEEPVESGDPAVTRMTPTSVEVYICETDYETDPDGDGEFRLQIVTDEVLTVAVFDWTLPAVAEPVGKTGLYGHIELIDGMMELTWVGC